MKRIMYNFENELTNSIVQIHRVLAALSQGLKNPSKTALLRLKRTSWRFIEGMESIKRRWKP